MESLFISGKLLLRINRVKVMLILSEIKIFKLWKQSNRIINLMGIMGQTSIVQMSKVAVNFIKSN